MPDKVPAAEVLERLHQVPFLRELPGETLDEIRGHGSVRHYARGQALFAQGAQPEALFVVLRGSVRVFQIGASGREQVLTTEGAGSSVAELPLLDGAPYPAYGEAAEDSVVFRLGRERFDELLHAHPEMARQVIRVLAGRLRRLVQMVEGLALKEVRQRVAGLLVSFAEQQGTEFTLPASNEQIAAQLGTVREVVSRAVHGFVHEGLIELEGRGVRVLDLDGLRERT
jgi:CRP/FNR family cyclic AMP-dependent transcriptional regulator